MKASQRRSRIILDYKKAVDKAFELHKKKAQYSTLKKIIDFDRLEFLRMNGIVRESINDGSISLGDNGKELYKEHLYRIVAEP